MTKTCPCCGFSSLEKVPYKNEYSIGMICPCCFFGFSIDENSFLAHRKYWISQKTPFMDTKLINNKNWTLDIALTQIKNIKSININEFPSWVQKLNVDWNNKTYENDIIENWN